MENAWKLTKNAVATTQSFQSDLSMPMLDSPQTTASQGQSERPGTLPGNDAAKATAEAGIFVRPPALGKLARVFQSQDAGDLAGVYGRLWGGQVARFHSHEN